MEKLRKRRIAKKLSKKAGSSFKKGKKRVKGNSEKKVVVNFKTEENDTMRPSRKRKFSLSESSLGSSTPVDPKQKRVSFAEKLEHTKVFENSVKKLKVEPSTASPGKSILMKKKNAKRLSSDKKDVSVKENVVETDDSQEPKTKASKKAKLQVTKKVKEKLLSLPRKERKQFLRELRKKRKPNFELGMQCKQLWEVIRSSKCKAADKEKLTSELFGLIKGRTKELIYSHDTCRVIQYLTSLPRPGIRAAIFEELTPEIVRMSKSQYAHFFVAKMLRCGTAAQRNIIMDAFRGHCVALMRKQFAATSVLELAYNDYANARQRWNILIEFYGNEFVLFRDNENKVSSLEEIISKDPSKKSVIVGHLEEVLKDIVTKRQLKMSLTHQLLRDFFAHCNKEQRLEMIDSLKDRIPEIIHTSDGSSVALQCVWHGSAKERKSIVKSFKGYAVKAAQEEFGHRVLIGIFDSVDDTVLVSKFIIQELANNIRDVAMNQYGIRVLHYLVYPRNPHYFSKSFLQVIQKGDGNEHSKKEAKDRYSQLFSALAKPLYTFLAGSMEELILDQNTALLVFNALACSGDSNVFEREVSDADRLACYEAIAKVCSEEFIPCNTERFHAVEHPQAHFVISNLITFDSSLAVKLSDSLAKLDPEQIASWVTCNKGCFIVLHMFEHGTEETQKLLARVIPQGSLKSYSNKGAVLLLKKLSS